MKIADQLNLTTGKSVSSPTQRGRHDVE